jgi:hypothetical protein
MIGEPVSHKKILEKINKGGMGVANKEKSELEEDIL